MNKILIFTVILCLIITAGFAQNFASGPIVQKPVYFDVSPPLRDMVGYLPLKIDNSWKDGIVLNHNFPYGQITDERKNAPVDDPNVQRSFGPIVTDTTLLNFDGNSNTQGFVPPDTYGDVGPNHYFQVVNRHYSIYNKSGTLLLGPLDNSSMWSGMPNNANSGDAIVVYDDVADRWLFSQFSIPNLSGGPFYQMIAVSATPDPAGPWYRYQYLFPNFGDYPKFGVWPDGYYMTVNRFTTTTWGYLGTGAMAFDRAAMLAGNPNAQVIEFDLPSSNEAWSMLPSDCDGTFPPPGTPNYVTYQVNGHLGINEFHVDWDTIANSTFSNLVTLPVNAYNGNVPGIPQMGTRIMLDPISGRIMYRLQFRKFTGHWSMAASGTVNVGSDVAGIRWYELRNAGSGWSVYQQGTYAPDSNCRWMGSIAMDSLGDMALGFSISSSGMYPSIHYTGRFANDPLNEMTISERGIFNGTGYENAGMTGNQRWGDYSGMSADPSAANIFWYTQMYYATSGSAWRSRIASFSFAKPFLLTGSATPPEICNGQSSQLNVTATGGSGRYTWSWTSIPPGFTSSVQNPLVTPVVTTLYIAAVSDGTSAKTDTVLVTVNSNPISNAGTDESYPDTILFFPASGTASSYRSVKWLTDGDGYFSSDTVPATLYDLGAADKNSGRVDLTLKAYPIVPCTDTASSTVHITLTLTKGIEENSSTVFGFTVSPNPSRGIFSLVITGIRDAEATITLFDINGKEIYSERGIPANEQKKEIHFTGYPKGTYFIKVSAGRRAAMKKLVLE